MTNRIKIYRDVYGPGKRASGARFRDEVGVCTGCGHVYRHLGAAGRCIVGTTGRMVPRRDVVRPKVVARWPSRDWDQLVPEPCLGLVMPPITEQGYRWCEGTPLGLSSRYDIRVIPQVPGITR